MKFVQFLGFLIIFLLNENVLGKPQDIAGAAVMAASQIKDSFDNGAAAKDNKEFEVLGAKAKSNTEVGFGDAMRSKRSSQDLEAEAVPKRYANIPAYRVNAKEKLLRKRAIDNNVRDNVNYSDSFSSLSSSSSSSEEEN